MCGPQRYKQWYKHQHQRCFFNLKILKILNFDKLEKETFKRCFRVFCVFWVVYWCSECFYEFQCHLVYIWKYFKNILLIYFFENEVFKFRTLFLYSNGPKSPPHTHTHTHPRRQQKSPAGGQNNWKKQHFWLFSMIFMNQV